MRVTNDTAYRSLLRDIEQISERMQTAQMQISSGKRITKASDDPTAISDVLNLRAEQSEIAQYKDNIATGRSRLGLADSTLQSFQTMIDRVRTLALTSLNDISNSNVQAEEISSLREQILATANTNFDGQYIFAGSNVNVSPYTMASDGTVTYNGDANAVKLQIGRSATLQVQVPGSEVFSGSVDVFATIKDLLTAMNSGDTAAVEAQVSQLEQLTSVVSTALGKVGGLENVAQSIDQDLTQYSLARTAEQSRLEDADLPKALTDYTQAETALRATTAVGARITDISILDYLT